MGFLDLNLADTPEIGPVEAGEYQLLLVSAKIVEGTTNGRDWVRIASVHSIVEEDTAETLFYTLWLPSSEDTTNQQYQSKNKMLAHGLDIDEVNPEDWGGQGLKAYAILGDDEYEGVARNKILRFNKSA